MTDTGTPTPATTRFDLNPSEVETVRQALEHLMLGACPAPTTPTRSKRSRDCSPDCP